MATINSKKLLPPSKAFSSRMKNKKVLIPSSNIRVKKNVKSTSDDLKRDGSGGISSDSLLGIKNIISKIQGVLSKSSLFQKKEQDNKRKGQEKESRKRRESKLEKKSTNKNVASGIASLPNLSFIDRIKKFLFWTILGRLFSDLFPKLIEFSKRILPVIDFVENFAGNILKGVVDFIDWGYNAYDKVRDLTKQIGGENAQKVFDDFSKHFNTFINLALIAAMAGSSIGGGGSDKPGKPGKPGTPGQYGGGGKPTAADRTRNARIRNIQKQYGPNARKIYENALNNGKTPQQAEAAVKKGFKKGITIRPGAESLAARTAKKGSLFKRGLGKLPQRFATKTLGKAGVKIAGKALGRIPIIGGLVDFLFALWSGEKPGRAAAKAVGATIGSALGTFIPIPLAGTILGGILGDIVGGALYDTLVAGNNKKTQAKAKGGSITRGGKRIGTSPRRSIKVTRVKKPNKISPQRTIVGKDVGGKQKIEDIYGKGSRRKKRNPVRLLKRASRAVKKNDNVLNGLPAAMFGAGIDMTLGQKPDKNLSVDIGNMFGSVIQTSVNSEISKLFTDVSSILTRAEGGTIPASRNLKLDNLDIGKKVGNEISQKLISSINSSFSDVLQNLNREFRVKDQDDGGITPDVGPSNIQVSSDSPDFWLLTTAALFENGKPDGGYQGAADVAQAIYNRVALPGWPKSIRKVILEPGQFQPVRTYGNAAEWNKINSRGSAIEFAKKHKNYSGNIVDRVAAALLNTGIQQKARDFVGPRDNFRNVDYEKSVDHLDDTTEVNRYEHVFGFEPGGANIGKFKKGQLTAAMINQSIVRGTVTQQDSEPFTGKVSGQTFLPLPGATSIGDPSQNQNYGANRGGRSHQGVDLTEHRLKDSRAPIVAWATGKVIKVENGNLYPGGSIEIDHGGGIVTRYLHVTPGAIRVGDTVYGGEQIGRLYRYYRGGTEQTHLHFEVYKNNKLQNPTSYVTGAKNKISSPLAREKAKENYETAVSPVTKNQGVVYKDGKFVKLAGGLFGMNQELKVTDTQNTSFRELQGFGLGRGSQEGEKKKAADGNYYEWKKGKWVLWNPAGPGANASLPTSSLSQSIAQVSGKYTDNLVIQRVIINRQVPVPYGIA